MARAFNNAHSVHRKDSIANVKYGYKECSQVKNIPFLVLNWAMSIR